MIRSVIAMRRLISNVIFLVIASGLLLPAAGVESREVRAPQTINQHTLFRMAGAMYGLDPQLLEAVAQVESGGRADAISPKGAVGLMQLMPQTAARFQVSDSRDPVDNALGAARYLSYLRDANLGVSGADLPLILAAYNSGEGAVSRHGGIPPYSETREYVVKVLTLYLSNSRISGGELRLAAPAHVTAYVHSAKRPHGPQDDTALLDKLESIRRARDAAAASRQAAD